MRILCKNIYNVDVLLIFKIYCITDECGIVYSGTFNSSDVDLPEKLCSEHIASLVNLKWQLSPNETCGIASLRGISLSSTMLDLVTVAPIQFGNINFTLIL